MGGRLFVKGGADEFRGMGDANIVRKIGVVIIVARMRQRQAMRDADVSV